MNQTFAEYLKKYADVIVKVGLNLQDGQRLLISSPLAAVALVHAVTDSAYRHGARYVGVIWSDPMLERIRLQHAPLETMNEFPEWVAGTRIQYMDSGDAVLTVSASDPEALSGLDPEKLSAKQRTDSKQFQPLMQRISSNASPWLVVSAAVPAMATKIFPDLEPDAAVDHLWDAIFDVSRIYSDDPVAAWRHHMNNLKKRCAYLNGRQYTALQYTAPGTDLMLGLPENHYWEGASSVSQNGIEFAPNIPTEEVFTLPHKDRVDGVVTSTKPLTHNGQLIDRIALTFENGVVVNATAENGQEALYDILNTDDGARRLGEVALVPHSSPISQSGILFYNTLFDENASNHLAVGGAYRFNLQGGTDMSEEEFAAAGGNDSMTHVDFMIGSGEMDIDGVLADGTREPVMRGGDWAFAVD